MQAEIETDISASVTEGVHDSRWPRGSLGFCDCIFFLLTAVQTGAVWLHPVFPNQDGPMQFYYVDVLRGLISGASKYSEYFRLQGYFHPYSFFPYAALFLNQVFQPLTTERILVSLYLLLFSFGARFLIRSVNPQNDWLPVLVVPLAFNAYLCLGIYNFSFAIATTMFAMGLWIRWSGTWTAARSLLWLALLMLLATMHQTTVGFMGVFMFAHLAARFRAHRKVFGQTIAAWKYIRSDVARAAMVMAPICWIGAFVSFQSSQSTVVMLPLGWVDRMAALIQMQAISPYLTRGYEFCFLLLVLLPPAFWFLHAQPRLTRTPANARIALWISAVTWLATYAFGPLTLFGAGYFAQRMALPAIVLLTIAQSTLVIPMNSRKFAAVVALGASAWMLTVREQQTAEFAADLMEFYNARQTCPNCYGAIIGVVEPSYDHGLSFNPYFWAPVEYARREKAVLFNTPWVNSKTALFTVQGQYKEYNDPSGMRKFLTENPSTVPEQVSFLCDQSWEGSPQDRAQSVTLARRLGFVQALKTRVFSCYTK